MIVLPLVLTGSVLLPAQQPGGPPKLDVPAAMAALATTQIYRAPGAVARFDEQRVRAELAPNVRVLVAPYTGAFEPGNDYASGEEHSEQVTTPLRHWAEDNGLELVTVEGLLAGGIGYGPSDIPGLRQHTAHHDVTEPLLAWIRRAKGIPPEEAVKVQVRRDEVIAPTEAQTAALAEHLRRDPIYNAPGREDRITLSPNVITERTGFTVRIAALPVLDRGQPLVDYAPALARHFPGDVIMVSTGGWLDVAGVEADRAESARSYAYGRYELGSLRQGLRMDGRISTVLLRLRVLVRDKPFGRPLPEPFDLRRTISDLAPWVLLGSAVVFGAIPLARWYVRHTRRVEEDEAALRLATAGAYAEITALGEALLEDDDAARVAAAAERHGTARSLFEQARTAAAMDEVGWTAKEGQRLLARSRAGES